MRMRILKTHSSRKVHACFSAVVTAVAVLLSSIAAHLFMQAYVCVNSHANAMAHGLQSQRTWLCCCASPTCC